MKRAFAILVVLLALSLLAEACGFPYTFRAYISKGFWQPFRRYTEELAIGLPKERGTFTPFAGMGSAGSAPIEKLRLLYQLTMDEALRGPVDPPRAAQLRDLLRNTMPLTPEERRELDLLRCKVELRLAELGNDRALATTQACFEAYLAQSRPAAYASEARGWLARTYFLRKNYPAAAKIYLAELAVPTANIAREKLLTSLAKLYRDDDRVARLQADLPQYFQSPRHAIYVSDVITNLGSYEPPTSAIAEVNSRLIRELEQHRDLFKTGPDSDALALSLMRASLRAGDSMATLRYAELIPPESRVRTNAEYGWLVGAAHVLNEDYSAAETPLLSVVNDRSADHRQRTFAATALVRTFEKLGRAEDQLWAAVRATSFQTWGEDGGDAREDYYNYFWELESASLEGVNMDLAYLLDVQLTDDELKGFLTRYASSTDVVAMYPQKRTGPEMVRYELAVRHARREEYEDAAKMFSELKAWPRARRMREAAKLWGATRDASLSAQRRLDALYRYGYFLSENSQALFFNDAVWNRIQNWVLLSPDGPVPTGMSQETYRVTLSRERELQDSQEELWHAYHVLDDVVDKAGPTPLGFRAATRAIISLRRISARFGRREEIQKADTRLTNWLIKYRQYPRGWIEP